MPIYVHRCEEHGVFEAFRNMAQSADPEECPECGALCPKRITIPRVRVKAAAESPNDSVKRLMDTKRGEQHFDNPWTQERIQLKGSKKDREDQIVKSVLDSPMAKNRAKRGKPLQKSDITIPNL